MLSLFNREPAAVLAALSAILGLAVAFGLELSDEQLGAIMAAAAALVGVLTRSRVTPI